MTNYDILCFSSTDWEGVWGSRQQVMQRLAQRGHRILFIEQPAGLEQLFRYPALRRRKRVRWREGIRQIRAGLWIASLPPLLPGRFYSPQINRANQRLTAAWCKRFLAELPLLPQVLWIYRPEMAGLVACFGEQLSVYHCIDEFTAGTSGRKRQNIAAYERELLQRVDLVFANSLPTFESKRQLHTQVYRVPSGADVDHFARAASPDQACHPAVVGLKGPRLGYMGNVNERLDFPLLEYVAKSHPEWTQFFIGDTYPWTRDAPPLRRLQAFPNVHLLGPFPYDDLPALLKGMDVCLIPYVGDERARYRSPLKLYEYLAAGKPVVATDHPEARELRQVIYLADSPEQFALAVAQALADDNQSRREERLRVARENSWDQRVNRMMQLVEDMLTGQSVPRGGTAR